MYVIDRLADWALRRKAAGRGRLMWLDDEGRVVDVGSMTRDELRSLAWAHGVAYRLSRERGDRSRLMRSRDAAARLGRAAKLK